jgi:hypothetical protein
MFVLQIAQFSIFPVSPKQPFPELHFPALERFTAQSSVRKFSVSCRTRLSVLLK